MSDSSTESQFNLASPQLIAAHVMAAIGAFAVIIWLAPASPWVYLWQIVLLVAVIYLISIGADWFVDAASRLAEALGVSHLVIGLTVVAFGTSAPEVAASVAAGIGGNGDITIANVIGSNIFNLCFILGGVAAIVKGGISIDRPLVVRDGPVMLVGTVLLFAAIGGSLITFQAVAPESWLGSIGLLDLTLQRWEGAVLLLVLFTYLGWVYRQSRNLPPEQLVEELGIDADEDTPSQSVAIAPQIVPLLVGLVMVAGGCQVLVGTVAADPSGGLPAGYGAVWFANIMGIPDYVVGVTIVAAGTSAPEAVVSLFAAVKGAHGISTGNLLGSVIFNVLAVTGVVGLLIQPPIGDTVVVNAQVIGSFVAVTAIIVTAVIFMRTGWRIRRWEGVVLLALGLAQWLFDFSTRGVI